MNDDMRGHEQLVNAFWEGFRAGIEKGRREQNPYILERLSPIIAECEDALKKERERAATR